MTVLEPIERILKPNDRFPNRDAKLEERLQELRSVFNRYAPGDVEKEKALQEMDAIRQNLGWPKDIFIYPNDFPYKD